MNLIHDDYVNWYLFRISRVISTHAVITYQLFTIKREVAPQESTFLFFCKRWWNLASKIIFYWKISVFAIKKRSVYCLYITNYLSNKRICRLIVNTYLILYFIFHKYSIFLSTTLLPSFNKENQSRNINGMLNGALLKILIGNAI